jgi:hypothetical protein
MRIKWKLISVRLEIVFVSEQDRSAVCTKHAIRREIILDTPMVLLGGEADVEARFGPFGDRANLDTRKVHGLR